MKKKKNFKLRNPNATRPWQHILEVIRGYLQSAIIGKQNYKELNGEAFNFGPKNYQNKSVIQLVKFMKKNWNLVSWKVKKEKNIKKESKLLKLNSNKSKKLLFWEPILNFGEGVELTADWYKSYCSSRNETFEISKKQIFEYEKKVKKYFKKKGFKIF